ncbi:T9SS type A sorting domain-containing protein, partial [bacterium]
SSSLDGIQILYHYIDSVSIDSVGFIDTCDCGTLNQDIQFHSETRGKAGECCRVIFLKISNQLGNCRISEFLWDKIDGVFGYDTVNINEIGHLELHNDIYYPVDTVCYDESLNNSILTYDFKFRTFGSKEFRCTRIFYDTLDCYDLPCTWLKDSLPDPNDPSKQAVRLEITSNGTNSEGQCCYTIEFINNSPYKINADLLDLSLSDGIFTRAPSDFTSIFNPTNTHQDWYSWEGFEAHSSFTLGTICIDQGVTATIKWILKRYVPEQIYGDFNCFEPRYEEISCGVCCPETELFKTIVQDSTNCCISLDSLHLNCGDSAQYYKLQNGFEVPISLPYLLCADNSDLQFRVKIMDHDTVFCIKNYDFNQIVQECSCCNNIFLDIMKDDSYNGSGCRFIINRIYGLNGCNIDSTVAKIEHGKVVNSIYQKIGTIDYNNYNTWLYTMNNCQKDTLRFNFIVDSALICSKDVIVQCQTCEDLNINVIREYEHTEYYNGGNDFQIQITSCCIDIEVQNPDSGSCDFYGIFYQESPVLNRINIFDNGENKLHYSKDTLTICGGADALSNGYTGSVSGTYAIYDANGNLVCSMHYEHTCEGFNRVFSKLAKNNDIDMEQILVRDENFKLKLQPTKELNYKLYNLRGQLLYREDSNNNEKTELVINTANLTNGVYSVYIETDYGIIIRLFKVVK